MNYSSHEAFSAAQRGRSFSGNFVAIISHPIIDRVSLLDRCRCSRSAVLPFRSIRSLHQLDRLSVERHVRIRDPRYCDGERELFIKGASFVRSRCLLADDAVLNRANKPDEILESIARVFPKEFMASNKKAHRSLSLYSIELGLFGRDTSALAPAREGGKKRRKKKRNIRVRCVVRCGA